ncbi:MAG: hypothetical protein ACQES8_02400 [Thermodesulfobacteriota bacterium]
MKSCKKLLIAGFTSVFLAACFSAQARPPKPGNSATWVPQHRKADGRVVPGHFKYKKVWVAAHKNRRGRYVPGH